MNISTGGPHILLFERDQQLAALLISELQLAGYECHTARTAVEVFDAIARHSIRLVLVNLAQAATARREFWVALDTQRRDRKVQVFTFRCTNLAGYGPRDPDDHAQGAIADMEIDGMLGLMSLVDAVRARIPGPGTTIPNADAATTMPRMQKISSPLSNSASNMTIPRPTYPTPNSTNNGNQPGNAATYRTASSPDNLSNQMAPRINTTPMPQMPVNTPIGTVPPTPTNYTVQTPANSNSINITQPTYTEKIRAVLYPNQRTWSTQNTTNTFTAPPEQRVQQEQTPQTTPFAQNNPTPFEGTALQRLATGQLGNGESGLAQLSRMAQGYRNPSIEDSNYQLQQQAAASAALRPSPSRENYQQPETPQTRTNIYSPNSQQFEGSQLRPTTGGNYQSADGNPTTPFRPISATPGGEQEKQTLGPISYIVPTTRPTPTSETIADQPLRASPIQGIPVERGNNGQGSPDLSKRPDVLTRTNYGQQLSPQSQQPSAATPTLASIITPMPAQTKTEITPQPEEVKQEKIQQEPQRTQNDRSKAESEKEQANRTWIEQAQEEIRQAKKNEALLDESIAPSNAVLLDIVQSLPPIADLPKQSHEIQPQVLSGRATRSLGNVLLDGHLVPQDRLEVAQNIQRMLRGVDLNYQLGEILLMFKLLTPDQLLAASLVSFGMITTTQISALGRIRQELHAIGLEYDLENLLILFRILTPEQLREVRSSLQQG